LLKIVNMNGGIVNNRVELLGVNATYPAMGEQMGRLSGTKAADVRQEISCRRVGHCFVEINADHITVWL
jgi:hypothetical protein